MGRVMKEAVNIGITLNFLEIKYKLIYHLLSIGLKTILYFNSTKSYYTTKISAKYHIYIWSCESHFF